MHRFGEGCQKETTVTPTGDYSNFPTKAPPKSLRLQTGEYVSQGEGSLSAQWDTIRYRSDPDQLPRQCSILGAAEPNPTASPEASRPCSTGTG